MLYCPPNATLADVWINHGFSVCFFETVTSSKTYLLLFYFLNVTSTLL